MVLFTLFASGCGTLLNTFYDEQQTFIDTRDAEVGENIDELLRHTARPREADYLNIVQVDSEFLEYRFASPSCAWSTTVSASTREVLSWRFLGDPSGCRYKKFYEGPW